MPLTNAEKQRRYRERKAEKAAEGQAAVLDAVSEPLVTLEIALKAAGLNPIAGKKLIARIKARNMPVTSELRAVKAGGLIKKIEDRIDRVLDYVDDEAMASASFKDLAVGLGILIDKRQLLSGEPTHIISSLERASLTDLIPLMHKEAERRTMTLEQNPEGAFVLPRDTIPPVTVGGSLTDKGKAKKIRAAFADGEPRGPE